MGRTAGRALHVDARTEPRAGRTHGELLRGRAGRDRRRGHDAGGPDPGPQPPGRIDGFGRLDMVENRRVGIKSREVYECPAALALIAAHADLEDLVLERDVHHEKGRLETRWSELVYDGMWFSPLKEALDAFIAETQRHVSGDVRLRFEAPGLMRIIGRRSPKALYDYGLRDLRRGGHVPSRRFRGLRQDLRAGRQDLGRTSGREKRHAADTHDAVERTLRGAHGRTLWDLSESYSFDHVLYAHDIQVAGPRTGTRGRADC